MFKRVNEILIGKNIDRYAGGFGGQDIEYIQAHIAEGEVVVLTDKYMGYAAATDSYATTPVIYIAEGSADTRTVTKQDGTESTIRRLIISAPIDGKQVLQYNKNSYAAKSEQSVTFGPIQDTIVAGTEYLVRLVYKDIVERPAPLTETYRYVAKQGDTSTDVYDGIRNKIRAYRGKISIKGGARITPNANGEVNLILTAKPIPECTSSVKDIDEFTQVQFEAFLNYVDNDGYWTELETNPVKAYTEASRGSGVWEVIRDVEKHSLSYRGIENRIWFPVAYPEIRAQKGGEYNEIVIEHNAEYVSADNQYLKETMLTTQVALEKALGTAPTENQGVTVEASLDDWMASLPTPKSDDALGW